jgi:hypothetical protein
MKVGLFPFFEINFSVLKIPKKWYGDFCRNSTFAIFENQCQFQARLGPDPKSDTFCSLCGVGFSKNRIQKIKEFGRDFSKNGQIFFDKLGKILGSANMQTKIEFHSKLFGKKLWEKDV